ncbi:SDR family oxidoreductase [Sphingomonas chungangi]|nr:SDR family oxidoreductase [Sphingomonas chungangi]
MLEGRSIIVTGAASGIGAEAARRFAAAGARLTLADRAANATIAEEIRETGGIAQFVAADVSDEAQVRAMVAQAVSAYGRLDGAFNNAGVDQQPVALHEVDLAEWRRVTEVDLTGVFLCMKHEIAAMLDNGGGAIVNTSSVLGAIAVPKSAAYIAAKHGVIGLTRAAAVEYARRGIRANAILPGAIATPMFADAEKDPAMAAQLEAVKEAHPINRMGTPAEIAALAAYLLSDAAGYTTGAAIPCDGGFTAT